MGMRHAEVQRSPATTMFGKIEGQLAQFDADRRQRFPMGEAPVSDAEVDYLLSLSEVLQSDEPDKLPDLPDYMSVTHRDSRGSKLDAYNRVFEPQACVSSPPVHESGGCEECGSDCRYDAGVSMRVCTVCGVCQAVHGQTAENMTFQQQQHVNRSGGFSYERRTHLRELTDQLQGFETIDIPEEVIDAVIGELRKHRITSTDQVTRDLVDKIVHQLGLSAYYDNVVSITAQITGVTPPPLSAETLEKIQAMFRQLQGAWQIHKPPGRKNMIAYSTACFQIFRLLELDEYLPYFRRLKSPKRRAEIDRVWKLMCAELGWQYYPST